MNIPRNLLIYGGAALLALCTLGMIIGVFLAERAKRKRFNARVSRVFDNSGGQATTGEIKKAKPVSLDPSDRPVRSFVDPLLCRLLAREVMPRYLTRANRVVMLIAAGFGGWLVFVIIRVLGALPIVVATPAAVIAGWAALRTVFEFVRRREEMRFLEGFPESMGIFTRMVRAGLPVPEAIRTVGYEGPAAVADAFKRMSDRIAIGDPMGDVLMDAAKRLEIAEFRFFVVALNIQRETGGNLALTLDNLADIIRKRRASRQRAYALMSEVRASIGILTALPFVVGIFLWFQNPKYISLLFTTDRGRFILFCAIALLCTGLGTMQILIKRTMRGA